MFLAAPPLRRWIEQSLREALSSSTRVQQSTAFPVLQFALDDRSSNTERDIDPTSKAVSIGTSVPRVTPVLPLFLVTGSPPRFLRLREKLGFERPETSSSSAQLQGPAEPVTIARNLFSMRP